MTGPPPTQMPKLDHWTPGIAEEAAFDAADCERILALAGEMKEAGIAGDAGDAPYRKGRVSWIRPAPDNEWLFARLWQACQRINDQRYRLELSGFTEPLQLGEYGPDNFYDWHLDFGAGRFSIRKLSFIVQLSDSSAYRGGAVEILAMNKPFAFPRTRGTLIVFPAYVLHRVAPVTEGTRHSLVGWLGGPPLR